MSDIREIKTKLNMTNEAIATYLAVSKKTVDCWMSGRHPVPHSAILALECLLKHKKK